MKVSLRSMSWMVAVALGASGCLVQGEERGSQGEGGGAQDGQIALVPAVEVDGLEELSARTEGTVFVDEVILHARRVAIRDTAGDEHDVGGTGRTLLRYSPAAGEVGLSRLWVEARSDYSELAVDVAPLRASPESLREESRQRGFDVSVLDQQSVVVRGVISVPAPRTQVLSAPPEVASGCASDSNACTGIVPDTAPASVAGVMIDRPEKEHAGIVPDTAPAHDEKALLPADGFTGASDHQLKPFTLVAHSLFTLGTALDPVVSQGGGVVRLHLDANVLFTDERVAELVRGALDPSSGESLVGSLRGDELSRSLHVEAGQGVSPSVPKLR